MPWLKPDFQGTVFQFLRGNLPNSRWERDQEVVFPTTVLIENLGAAALSLGPDALPFPIPTTGDIGESLIIGPGPSFAYGSLGAPDQLWMDLTSQAALAPVGDKSIELNVNRALAWGNPATAGRIFGTATDLTYMAPAGGTQHFQVQGQGTDLLSIASGVVKATVPVAIGQFTTGGLLGGLLSYDSDGHFRGYNAVAGRWDDLTVTGGPPVGNAGGDLAGQYPDPTIRATAVTFAKLNADVTVRLPPVPVFPADVAKVLTVDSAGLMKWQVSGATGGWTDTGTTLKPTIPSYSVEVANGQGYKLGTAESIVGQDNQVTTNIGSGGIFRVRIGADESVLTYSNAGLTGPGFGLTAQYATVAHGVQIGPDTAGLALTGMLQWNGTNFQGYNGTRWVNLDDAGGGASEWTDNPIWRFLTPSGLPYRNVQLGSGRFLYFGDVVANSEDVTAILGSDTDLSFTLQGGSQYFALDATSGFGIQVAGPSAYIDGRIGSGLVFRAVNQSTGLGTSFTLGGTVQVSAFNGANAAAGMIQWNNTNFQGYNGVSWVNLDDTGGGGGGGWTDTGSLLQPTKGPLYDVEHGDLIVHSQVTAQGASDGSTSGTVAVNTWSNGAPTALLTLARSRTANAAIQSGDRLGTLQWYGAQGGGTFNTGAALHAQAEQTFSATAAGTKLSFWTTPNGSLAAAEHLSLDNAGILSIIGSGNIQLVAGSGPIKTRLQSYSAVFGGLELSVNSGGGSAQDDATRSSWILYTNPNTDNFAVYRQAPGTTTRTSLWSLTNAGNVTMGPTLTMGTGTIKASLGPDVNGNMFLYTNNPWAPQDPAQPSWLTRWDTAGSWVVAFRPGGGAAGTSNTLFQIIPDGHIRVTVDPANALDLATKQYVDSKAGLWTDTGSALQSSANRIVAIPGGSPNAAVVLGSNTAKARLQTTNNVLTWIGLSVNRDLASGTQDDNTKPSWDLILRNDASDNFTIERMPAAGSVTTLLTLTNAGALTTAGGALVAGGSIQAYVTGDPVIWGAGTNLKGHLSATGGANSYVQLAANANITNAQDDATKPSFIMAFRTDADSIQWTRLAPGGAATTPMVLSGSTGKLTATLADNLVSRTMLQAGAGVKFAQQGTVTANASATTTATDFATITLNGIAAANLILISISACLAIAAVAAGQTYTITLLRGATPLINWNGVCGSGAAVEFPLPLALHFWDTTPSVGTVTYKLQFSTGSTGTNIHTPASNPGAFWALVI